MRLVSICFIWTIFTLSCQHARGETVKGTFSVRDEWPGEFGGQIRIPLTKTYNFGWLFYVSFDVPVNGFVIDETKLVGVFPSNKVYVFMHLPYNKVLHNPASGERNFQCRGKTSTIPRVDALLIPLEYEGENSRVALNRAINGIIQERPASTLAPTSARTTKTTTIAAAATSTNTRPWWENIAGLTTTLSSFSTTTKQSQQTTTTASNLASLNLRYNLRDVITKSLLFFEAQRSGLLPPNNRIPWRSHSALRDGSDHNVDLSGGYYTDGGFVKYGFPMAFSTTLTAWSLLEFRNAYLASSQIPQVMNALKWSTDYFIKCHVSTYEFYGQVSTSKIDGGYWGRPEDLKINRPSFKITQRKPGSDLAAETAAALAATAMVFRETNSSYSSLLIKHAEKLYKFADRYRGEYHKSIPDAANSYKSWSGFWDELAWGALWLHKATGEKSYLDLAKSRLEKNPYKEPMTLFNWDDKRAGALTLLAQITNENKYKNQVTDYCDYMLAGGGAKYTPGGLLFLDDWGPIRHSANVGFVCLIVANLGIRSQTYRRFAHEQLSYILGDGGRSYMVGFGDNAPKRPHHRASSCPDMPALCSWDDKDADRPNPQQLTGAVVGGPDKWDSFEDHRRDFKENGVAIDYNAGVQSLAAGILELQVTGQTFSEPNPQELQLAITQAFAIDHDYDEVLRKSLLFYEAQRSGRLPDDNRIPWRRSAFVDDSGDGGVDLSGGYFDAGDYVKFNFPMAFTTTALAWGVMQYGEAYEAAGEKANAKSAIKWATDYFIKCHVSKFELYGQVGSGGIDHSHWTTPEGMASVRRPAYKLTKKEPGSELVAETAAAMAAAAIVFRSSDSNYSAILLGHARDLYDFATMYRERYHRSIRDAASFYRSYSGYEDELAWASVWLYLATQERSYLTKAEIQYRQIPTPYHGSGFYWDQKMPGVQLLLAQITRKAIYTKALQGFCDGVLPGKGLKYTPKGLLYLNEWGPLRHAAGVAYICLGAANLGIRPQTYRDFGKRQIHYMLGDSGLGSYVIGYGANPPTRPHHRASSCPNPPARCNFDAMRSTNRNPHILQGALVGGPDIKDRFYDDRNNHKSNEVALDYNACFQSAIAALKYLELHPPLTTTTTGEPSTTTTTTTTKEPETTRATGDGGDGVTAAVWPDEYDDYFDNYSENVGSVGNATNVSGTDKDGNATQYTLAKVASTSAAPTRNTSTIIKAVTVKCTIAGITDTFDKCIKETQSLPTLAESNVTRPCRWELFRDCAIKHVAHCSDPWAIFKFWNWFQRDEPHFTERQQACKVRTTQAVSTDSPTTAGAAEMLGTTESVQTNATPPPKTSSPTTRVPSSIVVTSPATVATTTTLRATRTIPSFAARSTTPRIIRVGSTTRLTPTPLVVLPGDSCSPIKLFDMCAISRKSFPTHQIRSRFRCRYRALQACVKRWGSTCKNTWNAWPLWNNDYATSDFYFTETEMKCLEKDEAAKVNCEVSGITDAFEICESQTSQQSIAVSSSQSLTTPCRWKLFQSCVEKQIGHCVNAWKLFNLWNTSQRDTPHFSKKQQTCSSGAAKLSSVLSTLSLLFLVAKHYWTDC